MSDWLVAASLLPPTGAVLLLTRPIVSERGLGGRLEWVGASVVLALGFTSVMFFCWRALGGDVRFYAVGETALVGLLAVLALNRRAKRTGASASLPIDRAEPIPQSVAAATLAALTILASAVYVFARIEAVPHGEWDAWAIWNLRAAFLATPSPAWLDGFTPAIGWSHPDYPLLLPASVARLWSFAGFESTAAPIVFEVVVLIALVLVMAGTLVAMCGYLPAALALSLLLVPEFLFQATAQGADVVMGVLVLLSVVSLAPTPTVARLLVAGLAAGFAAWTKNEGLVAAMAVVVATGAVVVAKEGVASAIAKGKWLLTGVLPVVGVVVVFSIFYAPPKDLMTGIATTGPLGKLADVARHQQVAAHMLTYLAQWGSWTVVAPIWFVATWSTVALFRFRRMPDAVLVAWVAIAGMLAAYYVVYLLTPYDLTWHQTTSWSRLIAQMWPLLVWSAVAGAFATQPSSSAAYPETARGQLVVPHAGGVVEPPEQGR